MSIRYRHVLPCMLLMSCCHASVGAAEDTAPSIEPPFPSGGTGFCHEALEAAKTQLDGFRKAYPDPTQIPRSWENGQAFMVSASDWTSGFVAGSFWRLFEFTGDPGWRETAEHWTAALQSQQYNTGTHDLGFMMFNSFGNGYRLVQTATYEPVLMQSAESLMTRFNPVVGATRSWDHEIWRFPVIVDNMMNLELLYFASSLSGDKTFADAATSHALTTMKNHYRPDYSAWHVVAFDPDTGEVVENRTHQGIADESSWARGQAWGLYGFTMTYRHTTDPRFLEWAQNIAGFYLNHPNLPADKVPWFDFDAPAFPDIQNYRDSSAAAITASALLELAGMAPQPQSGYYLEQGLAMLRSLASPAYSAEPGRNGHFLLMHATGNQPAGTEIDAAINYADYYYLEALLRCARLSIG